MINLIIKILGNYSPMGIMIIGEDEDNEEDGQLFIIINYIIGKLVVNFKDYNYFTNNFIIIMNKEVNEEEVLMTIIIMKVVSVNVNGNEEGVEGVIINIIITNYYNLNYFNPNNYFDKVAKAMANYSY